MSILDSNIWNALGAIGENLGAALGGIALIYSISIYRASMMFMHYGELDKTYFDILNMAVERPYLRSPNEITDPEHRHAYEIYAFMVWNFLETIHDRIKDHAGLSDTWMPVLITEGELHRAWFEHPDNRPKFKPLFFNYIEETLPKKAPSAAPAPAPAPAPAKAVAAAPAPDAASEEDEDNAAHHEAPHSTERPHSRMPHGSVSMPRRRPGRPG